MLDSTAKTQPKWVRRIKWTEIDGAEKEKARVSVHNLDVDELEALGHEALSVAAEWRTEIAERIPAPPAYKVFTFGNQKIASWAQRPWALMRVGKGTSVVFLVREQRGGFEAWIVSARRNTFGGLSWERRFGSATTVNHYDLVHVFPHSLPDSPSLGDLEQARTKARAKATS